ncbi:MULTISPECIES: hypothetical protein [unclassified Pseudomonas]|uniref:hypothetical protein n=1 Tax=unclassified Pseudomonas TaxID=196821 RepID=UPI0002700E61|nr:MULTISPECIES: hypothetical protein [unclassified Pseudomonas]EJM02294.1 hypothetical protein PMI19_03009 [Pseudomonas sp. GM16]EJM38935.1 hypothetical protein PMI23_02590 [Pseudomonas sp. GM24]
MTKRYLVQIIEIDPIIEELIVLSVQSVSIRCFAGYCPSVIEEGRNYEAEFEMVLPDELIIIKAEHEEPRIEMLDDGFSCDIYGYIDGDSFRSVIEFADQGIHFEYPHLNGQFVKITAERIDVSF